MKDLIIDALIIGATIFVIAILIAMLTGATIQDDKWRRFKREHVCYTLDQDRAKCADGKIYWRPE